MSNKEVTLSDGRKATITRKFKVIDQREARRIVADKEDTYDVTIALVSRVALIDGRPTVYEDILQLDVEDFAALLGCLEVGEIPNGSSGQGK